MKTPDAMLEVRDLTVRYGKKPPTVEHVSFTIPRGKMVSLIGPNACGKSTVIKAVSRMISNVKGEILLDGQPIEAYRRKEQAQKMAVLLQNNELPAALTVRELVTYGRTPYLSMFSHLAKEDEELIDWAMERAGVTHLRTRLVGQLSGGERQRVLFAMAVTRQPKMLILDEPTTFLDICHQIELLDLVKELNRDYGTTVMMVLHDLNQAAGYSDLLYLMEQGRLVCHGTPGEVLTEENLRRVYRVNTEVTQNPGEEKPYVKVFGLAEANA